MPYYWVADGDARTVTQYDWQDGRYGPPTVLRGADLITCPLFPGLILPVERLFAQIAV